MYDILLAFAYFNHLIAAFTAHNDCLFSDTSDRKDLL